jgi:hypothetical protein
VAIYVGVSWEKDGVRVHYQQCWWTEHFVWGGEQHHGLPLEQSARDRGAQLGHRVKVEDFGGEGWKKVGNLWLCPEHARLLEAT